MEKAKEKEGKIVRCISPSGCYYRDSIIVFAIGRFIFNNGECAHHKVSNFTIKSRLSLGYHSKVERGWIQLRPWLLVSWSLSSGITGNHRSPLPPKNPIERIWNPFSKKNFSPKFKLRYDYQKFKTFLCRITIFSFIESQMFKILTRKGKGNPLTKYRSRLRCYR